MSWFGRVRLPVYSDGDDVVDGGEAREYYEYEPHQARPFDLAEIVVEVEHQMVGQGEAHHQVGYGQVQHELVGDERGEAAAHGDGEDGERVAADDEHHQPAVHDAPRPEVVEVRRTRLRRVPPLITVIAQYKVHTIAGRGRQRPPFRLIRRRL